MGKPTWKWAAESCKNWRPEMRDWIVSSVSVSSPNSIVRITIVGPWKPDGEERETLEFVCDSIRFPSGVGTSLRELDGAPEGTILVWDDQVAP